MSDKLEIAQKCYIKNKGLKWSEVKKRRLYSRDQSLREQCAFVEIKGGEIAFAADFDEDDLSTCCNSDSYVSRMLQGGKAVLESWLANKKFKSDIPKVSIDKTFSLKDVMEEYLKESLKGDTDYQKTHSLEMEAEELFRSMASLDPQSSVDETELGHIFSANTSTIYAALNPEWVPVVGGLVDTIMQEIVNRPDSSEGFTTPDSGSFLSFTTNDSTLDSSVKKATDSPKRASPSTGDELRKLQHEIKKAQTEIASLKSENSQLKDEGVRLRKVAITDTVMSTPSHTAEASQARVSAFPPVVYIIAAVILGLIIGKFIL